MLRRHPYSTAAVATALAILVASPLSGGAPATGSGARELAPGVGYRFEHDPRGPFTTHVLSVEPGSEGRLDTALGQDRLAGLEPASSIARRHRSLAAINGDFFLPTGRPMHGLGDDGVLLQAPMLVENALWATGQDSAVSMGPPPVSMAVTGLDPTDVRPLARLNDGAPGPDELALFTPAAAGLESPPENACSARLLPRSGPDDALRGPTEAGYVVDAVACDAAAMPPEGGAVLSAPIGGAHSGFLLGLPPGSPVEVSWSLGDSASTDLLGAGNVLLVENGQVSPRVDGVGAFYERHPRTGVGVTAAGQVLLVVVDGRSPGHSVGMTLREFADYLHRLGSERAVVLDGGGSTTMVVEGEVVNRPADGAERPVANALLVTRQQQESSSPLPFVADVGSLAASERAGQRAAADPGSAGGLAEARP